MNFMYRRIVLLAVTLVLLAPAGDVRADRIQLIRDAEIENTIGRFAAPLFRVAGYAPGTVRVHIVRSGELNAFVAGGANIFITTELLMRAETSDQVIGVIAHELGHIAGGHLSRTREKLRQASTQTILALILGAAAAVATGDSRAVSVLASGGQQIALRDFLSYSRAQEAAADLAALGFLDRAAISGRGLLEFMEILGEQELLTAARQDPYVRTHPLSRERVAVIARHVAKSPYSDRKPSAALVEAHARMRAKLFGFLNPPARTLERYKTDDSIAARIARAVALHRRLAPDKALAIIDGLIADEPENAYFSELKGQVLFESARADDAVTAYADAARLAPDAPLIAIGYAQTLLETRDPERLEESIRRLNDALQVERDNAFAWRLLATAQGRAGRMGMTALALGEEALLRGRRDTAKGQATRALGLLPKGSPAWLRADDILNAVKKPK
ncbi:MAG: M48 family metalloprotease [Alphaproteobacteria bacterium]